MKEFKYGNTKVIVHTPLVLMSASERKQWFENEWERDNPILKQIAQAVIDCYHPREEAPGRKEGF